MARTSAIDLLIGRWNADYDDPDNFTHTLFHSATGALRNYFSSPEADQILEEARAESRPAVRETLYRRFEGLLLESAALVPLFHDIDYRVASSRVRGLRAARHQALRELQRAGHAPAAEPGAEARPAAGARARPDGRRDRHARSRVDRDARERRGRCRSSSRR